MCKRLSLDRGPEHLIKIEPLGDFLAHSDHLVLIDRDNDYLISELSRVSYDLNPAWLPSQTLRKYQALAAQLHLMVNDKGLDDHERFEILKSFFFEAKRFTPMATKPKLDKFLLPYILLSRSGPPEILLLLFLGLARTINLNLQVIKGPERAILKFIDGGKAIMCDFHNQAQLLDTEEIIELINQGCDFTKILDNRELLTQYLMQIKTQSLRERSLVHFYKIQTYLVHHQPFILSHLVDRARAAYAIGDIVKAAEDIGQYLSFHRDKMNDSRFLKLLKKLRQEKLFKNLPYFHD